MKATGVYWRPVWHVLSEEGRTLILANAAHVKNVPGRKTDVADAVWLSDLLAHGLIRASFVPEAETQVMRTLMRIRKQLVREQASHVQRIQKTLEDANLKLASVLTDIMGQSGCAVLDALVAGERDPAALSGLVGSRVKAGCDSIRAALTGRIGDPHRFLLRLHLRQYDAQAVAVAEIDAEVERDLGPFRDAAGLLATIPGVSDLTAQVILPEIGPDMSRFPSAGHLISWAGLCPRNDESTGKRRSTRLKKGAPWLKTTLVQCAWAAARKKQSYLQAQFQRLRHRRGPKKAVCAVAASILTAAHHMLKDVTVYADLGPVHFQRRAPEQRAKALLRQIERLGFSCTITPVEPVSIQPPFPASETDWRLRDGIAGGRGRRAAWYDTKGSGRHFKHTDSKFRNWVTPDGAPGPTGEGGFPGEAGRYHLYVSLACPWAHRTLIVRTPKGLMDAILVSVVDPHMGAEGLGFGDSPGTTPDTLNGTTPLYEVNLRTDPAFTGPVLCDKRRTRHDSNV